MARVAKGEIARTVLGLLAASVIVAGTATCPGLLQVIAGTVKKKYARGSLQRAIYRLDKQGLILAVKHGNGFRFRLSKKGLAVWQSYELGMKKLPWPKTWDQKWRLLIFDIEEARKPIRDCVRRLLIQFGFRKLQDSVWVYPHDCREVLDLLRTRHGIRFNALFLECLRFDGDGWLKRDFRL